MKLNLQWVLLPGHPSIMVSNYRRGILKYKTTKSLIIALLFHEENVTLTSLLIGCKEVSIKLKTVNLKNMNNTSQASLNSKAWINFTFSHRMRLYEVHLSFQGNSLFQLQDF